MRILSDNECEMISGGFDNKGKQDGETREAERILKDATGKTHDCSKHPGPNGDSLKCTPRGNVHQTFSGF